MSEVVSFVCWAFGSRQGGAEGATPNAPKACDTGRKTTKQTRGLGVVVNSKKKNGVRFRREKQVQSNVQISFRDWHRASALVRTRASYPLDLAKRMGQNFKEQTETFGKMTHPVPNRAKRLTSASWLQLVSSTSLPVLKHL